MKLVMTSKLLHDINKHASVITSPSVEAHETTIHT